MTIHLLWALMASATQQGELRINDEVTQWVKQNAPYGLDITPDGNVWVNTNAVGQRDDYAILAQDLYAARQKGTGRHRLWIRGYHRRNPNVNYRESKLLAHIDCDQRRISIEMGVRYDAEGNSVSTGASSSEPIVPGSHGEAWAMAACPR